jgi:RNA polymerase sigma factor (sigma-70 family)
MATTAPTPAGPQAGQADVAVLLARWRSSELAYARTFDQCGGASFTEIEDLYDATATRLLEQATTFECEEHLRGALRRGIRLRALRMHRDRRVRKRVLDQAASGMIAERELRAWRDEPERALLAREDDLIVGEFLAELTPLKRQVFALVAEGRSWRAIATALKLSENEARNTTRACERKREHFTTLYTTGRLCGYRSHTIGSLLSGKENSELAVAQAFAHLQHCHTCQIQHKTDAAGLHAAFDARVLSMLPLPAFAGSRSSLLDSLQAGVLRVARLFQRDATPQAGVRERAVEIVAGSGASAKLAAGLAGVVLLAGGAVGAAHGRARPARHQHAQSRAAASRAQPIAPRAPMRSASSFKLSRPRPSHGLPRPTQQHTIGGLSYLGVSPPRRPRPTVPVVIQHGGGPFGP